jgi:C4-dicarboxylate-specific signal transduction histidine kinase
VNTVVQEITERKRIEEARQELAHASRLAIVGELTASIAHEINQPLGAILSNADAAEMLLESSPSSLDEVREILSDIRKDDLRAHEVIRRLRRLLQRRELQIQPLDLNELVAEVVRLVRTESARRGVIVRPAFANELPLIRGDAVHLQQVLLNIFLNGMEAMSDTPGEKVLTVRTAAFGKDSVEIAISDTGSGVAADQLSHLFDPFFSTKKEGMGLGLSISRSLVESQGGRIWATNNTGGGATFWITLPTDVPQLEPDPPAAETEPAESCR